jgi:hypothetical protein
MRRLCEIEQDMIPTSSTYSLNMLPEALHIEGGATILHNPLSAHQAGR